MNLIKCYYLIYGYYDFSFQLINVMDYVNTFANNEYPTIPAMNVAGENVLFFKCAAKSHLIMI